MTTPRRSSLPYLAAVSLLCLPISGYTQSILLTAEQFALLGGSAVTVAGAGPTTISNGDVGSAASISGFPPATIVNGTTQLGGAVVNQALTDLITARNGLTALPSPGANNLTGQDLSGKTLLPGVYKFDVGAEITLNGTKILTLDAQGKNNVTWVFNIGTSLTTAAGAQVQFINLGSNGGADNGLFWNAGTAITFGATNVIAGNYLAGTDITFGTTLPAAGSGSGRALALAGVSFDGSGTLNTLGAPGGGDLTGGLIVNGGVVSAGGYVLLSSSGAYAPGTEPLPPGGTRVVLVPGTLYSTTGVTIDGASADAVGQGPASLKVFSTIATLTGANTYTGGTVVDAGQLTTGAANLPLNGPVAFADSNNTGAVSVLTFAQPTNGTFGGAISGPGSLIKSDVGSLTLTGANTYTGGTAINGGALVATTATLPANQPVTTGDGTTLIFAQTSNGTFGGLISGTGSVVKQDRGTLTLTRANTYTGGTFVTSGKLIASSTTLPANGTVNLAANGGLVFDQTTDGGFGGTISGAGPVTKQGTGSLTLTAANTHTGGTTVNDGTLALAGTGTLGDPTGALAVDGGILDLGASSQTVGAVTLGSGGMITNGTLTGTSYNSTGGAFNAVLTGPGALTTANGTTTLTEANTYTGGTAINSGALIATTATLPANQAVTTGDGSALIFAQTSNGTFGGLISGTGSVVKQDAGSLTLTRANTYTGGTFVTNGTLIASTSTLPNGGSVNLAAGSIVVLDQTTNGVFGGAVSGLGRLEKRGTGSVSLAQALAVPVTVSAGSLFMNGGLGGTSVASGARLGGVGTITGNLTNLGRVSPGFSPGIINVTGNYTQGPGGLLVIEIASATSFDQLIVAGTASLGGTLQVVALGFDPVGSSYTVLSAAGGVTGNFTTFVAVITSATIDVDVIHSANAVTVTYTQIPFITFALTPNQSAVAAAAQQSPALTAALNAVPLATELPAALNALSPQGYEVWSDAAFARGTALADHVSRDRGALPNHSDFYFDVGQRRGRAQRDLDVGSASFDSDAALVGYNGVTRPGLVLGALFNYEDTDSDLGSASSHTESKSYLVGLRAAWSRDSWFVNSLIGYGHNDYESTRAIRFPGTAALARSSTEGREWLADVSAGRRFMIGAATLSPFVGVHAGGWNAKSFTETGAGVFNNTVGKQSAHSLQSQAGLEAAFDLTVAGVGLRPHVRAAWLHEFENDDRSIDAQIDSISYAVVTRNPERDSARVGVGLDATITPSVSLYADYSAQTGDVTRILGEWRAGVSIGF